MGETLTRSRSVAEVREAQKVMFLHSATEVFIDVSQKYSASNVAQAAAIAQYCREHRLSPLTLQRALLGNSDRLDSLASFGTRAHIKVKEENPESKMPIPLSIDSTRGIITTDFNWAHGMMVLTPDQLTELLKGYERSRESKEETLRYKQKARDMVTQKRIERGLLPSAPEFLVSTYVPNS